jgi:hypothetical protein
MQKIFPDKETAMRRSPSDWDEYSASLGASTEAGPEIIEASESGLSARTKRRGQAAEQYPMQIFVPVETRDALRQRSVETGASIRHIILRSLAADGFPVPKLSRWQK